MLMIEASLISVSVLRMRGGAGTGVEGTTEAVVSLFGRTATLVVPTGRDNVADLLEIFVKLDTSLSELKQENKVRTRLLVSSSKC